MNMRIFAASCLLFVTTTVFSMEQKLLDGFYGMGPAEMDVAVRGGQVVIWFSKSDGTLNERFSGQFSAGGFDLVSGIIPSDHPNFVESFRLDPATPPEFAEKLKQLIRSPQFGNWVDSIGFRSYVRVVDVSAEGITIQPYFFRIVVSQQGENGPTIPTDINFRDRLGPSKLIPRKSELEPGFPASCDSLDFKPEKTDTTLYARTRFYQKPLMLDIDGKRGFTKYPAGYAALPEELKGLIRIHNGNLGPDMSAIRYIYGGKGGAITEQQHAAVVKLIRDAEEISKKRCKAKKSYFETFNEFFASYGHLQQINETRRQNGEQPLAMDADEWLDQAKVRTVEFNIGPKQFVIAELHEDGKVKYLLGSTKTVSTMPDGRMVSTWDLSPGAVQEIKGKTLWESMGDLAIVFDGPENIFTRTYAGGESVGQGWIKGMFEQLKESGEHTKTYNVDPAGMIVLANMAGALKDSVPQLRDDFSDIKEQWDSANNPQETALSRLGSFVAVGAVTLSVAADVVLPIPALRRARQALKQSRASRRLSELRLESLREQRRRMEQADRPQAELDQLDGMINRQASRIEKLKDVEKSAEQGLDQLQQARYNYERNKAFPAAARPEYAGISNQDLLKRRASVSAAEKRRISEELGERAARYEYTKRSGSERQIISESGTHRHGPDQYYIERRGSVGQTERVHVIVESKGIELNGRVPEPALLEDLLKVRKRSNARQNYPKDVEVWADKRWQRDSRKHADLQRQIDYRVALQRSALKNQRAQRVADLQKEIDEFRKKQRELDRQREYWDEIRLHAGESQVELRVMVTDTKTGKYYGFVYDPSKKKYVRDSAYDGELPQ